MRKIIDEKGLSLEVELITDSWFARQKTYITSKETVWFFCYNYGKKRFGIYEVTTSKKKGEQGGRKRVKGKTHKSLNWGVLKRGKGF